MFHLENLAKVYGLPPAVGRRRRSSPQTGWAWSADPQDS